MRGQIIEKSKNVWLVRIESKTNGKRVTLFSKTVHGKKTDAEKVKTEKLSELDKGIYTALSSKETVAQYLTRWLETVAKNSVAEATFENYQQHSKNHIIPRIGSFRLVELRKADVQHFYNQMTADGIGARTVKLCHAILHSALNEAVRINLLALNPASNSKLPRWTRKEIRILTPEQAKAFRLAAMSNAQGCLLIFALETGMRPSEYLALKWSDIDLEKGSASVQRTLKRRKKTDALGTWYYGKPKTKKSRRTVPLSAELLKLIKSHRLKQAEHRLSLGVTYEKNDLVFASQFGSPLNIDNIRNRHFKTNLEEIGLDKNALRLYDLRHTCATLLLIAGISPKVVAERLGHSSVMMTLDTYSHVLPTMQEGATDKLAAFLYG